jgi:ATPase, P-type (transporting), HAD superfamily, subfamily IC
MKKYLLTGMNCAACAARVEKAVRSVEGVDSCTVSLLTNSMGVEGNALPQSIIKAVEAAGYGASLGESSLEDTETPLLKRRLIMSLGFLLLLMYLSMGHRMWNWPLPAFMEKNFILQAFLQLILTIIVMAINRKFFTNGFKGIANKAPNMDTLVALGSGAAFIYSIYEFAMLALTKDKSYMSEFYFESSAMILTLITVGKMLEARSKGKTTDALRSLMKIAPKTAIVVENGLEAERPIEQVKKGDIFAVYAGNNIPVDGIVIEGNSSIDESALTGESIPVEKAAGDSVSAATTSLSGYLRCEATAVGEDTTFYQIIRLVSDAAETKAPISRTADRISAFFVPVVMTLSLITAIVWLAVGETVGFALSRSISVLVISCPCALGLATPVAIMVANGVGAKHGILFKTAAAMEEQEDSDSCLG